MSESSYQLNLQRGVTGPSSSTCLVASYDRISNVTGVSTKTYERYEQLRKRFVDTVGDGANYTPQEIVNEYRELQAVFRRELGVPTPRNIVETRADTLDELSGKLAKLAVGGYRTAVYLDTGGLHSVGVTALGRDMYDVRSTWAPFPYDEPVHVEELFEYLDRSPRQRIRETSSKRTVKEANIVALPAEPAGVRPPYPDLSRGEITIVD